jgi:hypothetical protein
MLIWPQDSRRIRVADANEIIRKLHDIQDKQTRGEELTLEEIKFVRETFEALLPIARRLNEAMREMVERAMPAIRRFNRRWEELEREHPELRHEIRMREVGQRRARGGLRPPSEMGDEGLEPPRPER